MGVSSKYKNVYSESEFVGQGGTYRYMSREQLDGRISLKTDVWAYGCLLYEFATGLRPYHGISNEMAVVEILGDKK